jgi:hypothetical protein
MFIDAHTKTLCRSKTEPGDSDRIQVELQIEAQPQLRTEP